MYDRDREVIKWFCSGNVGVSSCTLCSVLYGIPPKDKFHNYPGDPSDFGRCKRFLDILCPEDKEVLLRAAAKISPQWKALIEKWDFLESIYGSENVSENMFAEMQKIIREAQID